MLTRSQRRRVIRLLQDAVEAGGTVTAADVLAAVALVRREGAPGSPPQPRGPGAAGRSG